MGLVVEVSHVCEAVSLAEDAYGDAFAAKLSLIAERDQAFRGGREGGEFALQSRFFFERCMPVGAAVSHRLEDLLGCEARAELSAYPLPVRGAGWAVRCDEPFGDFDGEAQVREGAGRDRVSSPIPGLPRSRCLAGPGRG